ncbi:YdcF family protein [Pseudorhizobium pelagicum]|uniref:Membrane protein n=1 Tax=Pseudorhizobium pelagicum TaxID=1509405 RepID=A0A922T5I2_9HYPH|nr:YdcF family protein [Pseudorhizobium pelagicum]KEQ04386.1 membrane protein [Pseudorhizobium pelagicum]KEQ07247.1 membrane protein [Pseudorhizobium pelagicum]
MFLVSKIFWLAVQPLSLAFLLSALGALVAFAGWRRIGATLSGLAAALLFVVLYTTAGGVALQVLEARFARPAEEPARISCIIVLGGALENEVTTSRGGIELNQAGERFLETLRLAIRHPDARIVVSGGDGSMTGDYEGEAAASERLFTAFGVSPERLVKENASRTTYENSLQTKDVLAREGLTDCVLVTSAFHMPRSMALFRKAGIPVTPWPVDYRTSGILRLGVDFSQPTSNAQITSTAVREWIGLVAYYLTGRIDAVFPAE